MKRRSYYSVRTGRIDHDFDFDLDALRELFYATYTGFEKRGCFQEHLGIDCPDGYQFGSAGDLDLYTFKKLRRRELFPLYRRKDDLTEDEIFDLIEFLFDHISTPVADSGYIHKWNGCGRHFDQFFEGTAKPEFREEINLVLRDYRDGFELSEQGEIYIATGDALQPLLEADVPTEDQDNVKRRIDDAVRKFRLRSSSYEDRRDAVRDLADVLEFIRPRLKEVLRSEDESDLFNIANNFAVRHHNQQQKTQYDRAIWLSWMFYFFLATIHAALRLLERRDGSSDNIR